MQDAGNECDDSCLKAVTDGTLHLQGRAALPSPLQKADELHGASEGRSAEAAP